MKATIKRIEQTVFYDLSGNKIRHMDYWEIYYSTGSKRTVKGPGAEALNKTQRAWYIKHKLQTVRTGFYCESATTRTLVYY